MTALGKPIRPFGSNRGFTLLELIVVIAVLAILVAMAIPQFSGNGSGVGLEASGRDIVTGLRLARSEAISRNKEIPFTLYVEERSFRVGDRRAHQLPNHLGLSLYTAESELESASVGSIRFFPDGTSTGGRITVSDDRSDTRTLEVRVEWMTGQAKVDR